MWMDPGKTAGQSPRDPDPRAQVPARGGRAAGASQVFAEGRGIRECEWIGQKGYLDFSITSHGKT